MTRITKLKRKTYLDATPWVPKPLQSTNKIKRDAPASKSAEPESASVSTVLKYGMAPVATAPSPEETPAPSGHVEAGTEAGQVDVNATENGAAPGGKKKRMRHKAMNKASVDQPGDVSGLTVSHGDAKVGDAPSVPSAADRVGLSKAEHEALKRRSRRAKQKERNMTCFLCRQKGHSIKSCPRASASADPTDPDADPAAEKCYRCGSPEHKSSECKRPPADPSIPYPHAFCFLCKKTGHLIAQCEMNERGLYPNGGSCRFCECVRHLARDCEKNPRRKIGKDGVGDDVTLGLMDRDQGGDDDDVFIGLKEESARIVAKKGKKRMADREKDGVAGTASVPVAKAAAVTAGTGASAPPKKMKKAVFF
ncbi:hypothetical protein HK101_011617 [Irineochytrium annulatum]|nr:hypothetical protein HK101_011617 [Irineochytrium annulatum]